MQARKHTTRTENGSTIKDGVVRDRAGAGKRVAQQQAAAPVETAYERQMRLMREIGEKDRVILAALAK